MLLDDKSSKTVEGLRKQEPDALHVLLQFTLLLARRWSTRFDFGPSEAEDVAHDTILSFYRKASSEGIPENIRNDAQLGQLLANILRNQFLQESREHRRHRRVSIDDVADYLSSKVDDQSVVIEKEEQRQKLYTAIGELSKKDQQVLFLRVVDDLSTTEIGAKLGMDPGYVRLTLHRVLQKLDEVLKGRGERL